MGKQDKEPKERENTNEWPFKWTASSGHMVQFTSIEEQEEKLFVE